MMTTAKECAAAVAEWVTTLRETELAQGRYSLRVNGGDADDADDVAVQLDAYCCLGIACEISGAGEWLWLDDSSEYAYAVDADAREGTPTGCLPPAVQRRLDVADSLGQFRVTRAWLDALETAYPATAARFGAYMRSNQWAPGDYVAGVRAGEIVGTATLSSLNDWGFTFAEIADVIESCPPKLFAAGADVGRGID